MKAKAAIGEVVLRAMLILALVVGMAPLAEAQSLAAKGKPAAVSAKSQASAKPSGGTQEGIKVHGHWTIVVRDPDGKEVSRREFENALLAEGKGFLARLLARQVSVGEWVVSLNDSNGGICGIFLEPTSNQTFPGVPKTLTVNFIPTPGGGSNGPGTVELKGNTQAPFSCDIARVETGIFLPQGGGSLLTGTNLQSPISVATGRLIEVTVILSFS